MELEAVYRFPVWRDSLVVGYATVDLSDKALVSGGRWGRLAKHYIGRRAGSEVVYLHRLILGPGPKEQVDHINGDRNDNRRSNLRLCTNAQNAQNRRPTDRGTSRHRGVCWHGQSGKWMARHKLNYRSHFLGLFDNEDDAAEAAEAWRRVHMPFAVD